MTINNDTIIQDPSEVLRMKAAEVTLPLSDEDRATLTDMIAYVRNTHSDEYCEANNCRASVGIAAPQINISKKMLAISIQDEDGSLTEYALVNPKIISNSTRKSGLENGESCLSVNPDVPGFVPRYLKVTVRAYNMLTDRMQEIRLRDYPAIVMQHEIDHLYGILYYDHINTQDPWAVPEGTTLF